MAAKPKKVGVIIRTDDGLEHKAVYDDLPTAIGQAREAVTKHFRAVDGDDLVFYPTTSVVSARIVRGALRVKAKAKE